MEDTPFRFCRKCLTRDLIGKDAYFENLQQYIRELDPSIKADEALYEKRLAVCTECDYLADGMCRACGCYVELRAAVERNRCSYNKW